MLPTKRTKKNAVASLLESAKSFLKNGATPDVVVFVEDTLEEISGVTIPAIEHASRTAQAYLYEKHNEFQALKDELVQRNGEVNIINTEEQAASLSHKQCRSIHVLGAEHSDSSLSQEQMCIEKQNCEMELYRLWILWVESEEDLKVTHDQFEDHVCPPDANGTDHGYRLSSLPMMTEYLRKKTFAEDAEIAYDTYRPNCFVTHDALEDRSVTCNAHQTTLEDKACQHALKISEVLEWFHREYDRATVEYNDAVETERQEEAIRHDEYIALRVVNCLLDRIHELNGVPCDASTGVDEEVGHCEESHQLSVCDENPVLCLIYPPVPPTPPDCLSRSQVEYSTALYPLPEIASCSWAECLSGEVGASCSFELGGECTPVTHAGGECLPVVQPWPCNADFRSQEYAALPAVPVAQFTENNPGCNVYPECSVCQEMMPVTTTATPVTYDSRLTAYWEFGSCGAHGNDHNWAWCGQQAGTCPLTVSVDSSLCASGQANRALWTPPITSGSAIEALNVDGCAFIYHAQYVCA